MDLGIAGRVALVGGGSSGLGLATATALARAGARVSLGARDVDRLEEARATVEAEGLGPVHVRSVDLRRTDEVGAWVDEAAEALGGVHIVVANGGGPPPGTADDVTPDDYRAAVETSMMPSISVVDAALPHLRRAGWGRVLMITSISVKEPIPGLALSNVARAGLLGYAKSLVRTVSASGITVNVLAPGTHRTPRLEDFSEDQLAGMVVDVPAGRIGDPAAFGEVAAFLASEAAGYVNGAVVPVDGGLARGLL